MSASAAEAGTVFVVDDDEAVRTALTRLLRAAGLRVEAFDCADAYLARPGGEGAACLLLDIQMPGLSGMDLQQRLNERGDAVPIVFLTGHGDIPTSVQVMRRGADNFLTKPVDEEALLGAVGDALARHRLILEKDEAVHRARAALASLTPREFEVMRCVLSGALNKRIAHELGISEKTVKIHRANVMKKMQTRSVAALVRLCERIGVSPSPVP